MRISDWSSDVCSSDLRPEMIEDARVTDPARRSESVGELYAMVAEMAKDWTTADLLAGLEEADIPAAAVTALDDLPDDPHLEAKVGRASGRERVCQYV